MSKTINAFSFQKYKLFNDLLQSEYYTYKPTKLECYFFPNKDNENYVVNMLRTVKKSLDIAIFCITNDKITNAILEVFHKGLKVRIIADDENCKMWGADVNRLAAEVTLNYT